MKGITLIGGGNDFGRCGEWFSLTGLTGLAGLFSGGGDLNLVNPVNPVRSERQGVEGAVDHFGRISCCHCGWRAVML